MSRPVPPRLAAPGSQPRAVTRVIIRPTRSTGRPAARSGRPASFRGELEDQEEEEDDGSEDDDEVEADLNRGTRYTTLFILYSHYLTLDSLSRD